MTDQNTFMENVKSVAEIIRTSEMPLSEKEILSYFDDMELDDNQKSLVLEYLMNPQPEESVEGNAEEGMNTQEEKNTDILREGEEEDLTQSAVFKMYLEELSYLPVYGKEEEEVMYNALLEGDESMIKKLSDCWLERVLTIAKKYSAPKLNVEDLIQEGNMALFLTLQKLCGSMEKVDVKNVLRESIEEGVMSYASEMNSEREAENTILGKMSLVHEAKKLLSEENGQEPTVKELAEYTKMSVEELEDLMDMIKTADGRQ